MGKSEHDNGRRSRNDNDNFPEGSDMENVHFTTALEGHQKKLHPADEASWWSYATFSWLSSFMFSTYRNGFDSSSIPPISPEDSSEVNTVILKKLIEKQRLAGQKLSFGSIVWQFAKRRILLTSLAHFACIFLGFLVPTLFMKKLLEFAQRSEIVIWEGVIWVILFILCELLRVFFFTLTWAMSYRTGIRLKIGSMGLIFQKLVSLRQINDQLSSVITTVITSDCNRIYDVIVCTQMALGGPCVLVFSIFYIIYELGFLPLVGLLVFPLSYPIQILLAKATGALRNKAIAIRDNRITFLSQALENMRFLKMFAWEKYYRAIIAEIRDQERRYLRKSQLFQSLGICINPTFPHIGIIVTFVIYVSTGNDLTATQAFCIVGVFLGRLRASIAQLRSAIRSYVEACVAFDRIQCFTILFLFSLFGYSIKSVQQLITFYYIYRIYIERMEFVLRLPEKSSLLSNVDLDLSTDPMILERVKIIRRVPQQTENCVNPTFGKNASKMTKSEKKELKLKRKEYQLMSVDKFIKSSSPEIITFEMETLDLAFNKGCFIGITGNIGSGKSTILKGIVGGIPIESGRIAVNNDRIAYVAQEPWIFKGSIRDNILFGSKFNPVLYYNSLYSCCLLEDVGIFPQGDNTSAFNLSGGQKQRVCLARALYHSNIKDVYLLDDPFSSLDSKVGKIVTERIINGQLKKLQKTVILVTHQLQYLQNCDEILVINDGKFCERGTHSKLMESDNSSYKALATGIAFEDHPEDEQGSNDSSMLDCSITNTNTEIDLHENTSTPKKKPHTGNSSIDTDVYKLFIQQCGGYITIFIVLLAFAVSIATTTFSSWWLKDWLKSSSDSEKTFRMYENENDVNFNNTATLKSVELSSNGHQEIISVNNENFTIMRNVYGGIIIMILVSCVVRSLIFTHVSVKAAHGLHCLILSYLFRSRIKSIEKAKAGQITNLFTKDMEEVDIALPNTLEFFLQNVFIILSIFIVVTAVFPVFLIVLLLLSLVFYFVRKVYKGAIRDLKRLEAETKTPIFTKVQETSSGLDTIRAYGKETQTLRQYDQLSDEYHALYYIMVSSMRWLSIRLDTLSVAVTGFTAAFIIIFHGHISAAAAGLALSYAAQLSGVFQYTVRLATETETKFISIERMKSFIRKTALEEPELFVIESKNSKNPEKLLFVESLVDIRRGWPYAGRVKFDAACFGYSMKTLVLNNISFEVQPGEKIGVIGRTGSGKTSLGSALFRLSELSSGQILIDDVDISDVPLSKLRNSLCVIPQESSIIQNSIRFNLDPSKMHSDDDLWQVLRKTGLKDQVDNLDSEVGLSQGQKQLLSVARAILRRSKIVFVDEATSNTDSETAATIDRLLIDVFQSSTIFIIAHRPSAVKYCDKLLVLDHGKVTNFGPTDLIRKLESFSSYFDQDL